MLPLLRSATSTASAHRKLTLASFQPPLEKRDFGQGFRFWRLVFFTEDRKDCFLPFSG
jgi:hypothetical protein